MEVTPEIEQWAKEQGYLFCATPDPDENDPCPPEGCGWVDQADEPVDIVALYEEAHKRMTWTTRRRPSSLIEHVCEHGAGHPNFYSVVRLSGYSTDPAEWEPDAIHACDGCCGREDFPGRRMANWELLLRPLAVYKAVVHSGERSIDLLAEWPGQCMDLADVGIWLQYTFHDTYINDLLDGKIATEGPVTMDTLQEAYGQWEVRYPNKVEEFD